MTGFSKVNGKADKKGLLETERRLRKPEWECCFSLLPFCFVLVFFMMSLEPLVFSAPLAALRFLCMSHAKKCQLLATTGPKWPHVRVIRSLHSGICGTYCVPGPYHMLRGKKEEGPVPDLVENSAYQVDRHMNTQLHYDVVGAKTERWTADCGDAEEGRAPLEEMGPRWHRSSI